MKKLLLSCFAAVLLLFGGMTSIHADEYLRIGMEAAYAPFNWTQDDDSNGAVPIEGTNQYANGYDVQIAKKIADSLGKELLVVKTTWTGLIPALTSGKIDMIAAGMSPTDERKKEIAFSDSYYTSYPVIVVSKKGDYANATSLADFSGAKLTSQQGVYLYNLIDQISGATKETAMGDFNQMRQALESGIIDGYVSERPDAISAENANSDFKMISFEEGQGFSTSESDTAIAVGLRKDDTEMLAKVNAVLAGISEDERLELMDKMIEEQPSDNSEEDENSNFFTDMWTIFKNNWNQFLRGAGVTLFISIIGTVVGLFIGLLIGVYRTAPKAANKVLAGLQKAFGWVLNVYIEVFRGTPMIVQAMVIYYGTAQAFGISIDRTLAAVLIVSINTGAYMSEIVRGGIFAVDKGQFEAATALGSFFHKLSAIFCQQQVTNLSSISKILLY